MSKQERLNYIYNDLRSRGIVRTLKDLADLLDVSYGNFTQAVKGDPMRLTDSLMAKVEALYANPTLEPMRKESAEWTTVRVKPVAEEPARPGSIIIPPELAQMFTDLAATIRSQQQTIERLTAAYTSAAGTSEKTG